ncbi:MAG: carboxylesterase family protein [Acidobacteriaceae bacterium]|nr:carboxylesterase family protein [Acidobacteriaceae bacterium]
MTSKLILYAALASVGMGSGLFAYQVRTEAGIVDGDASADGKIHIYKGIPYAAPPVGPLRWQPPQPAAHWDGIRKATEFGHRCMQGHIFADMVFRDPGPSEDCLNLNVWTPAISPDAKLPVMVWIYGGGFQAGASSEPRQGGENLARKGVIVVSMNYRLGIFGFFSHPELTKESPHHASGNYGLMDQAAALDWVQRNIAAFGGDPGNITIFGESAGSMSVSAQMASPLAKRSFKQAIGESGAVFMLNPPMPPVRETEHIGLEFAKSIGANTLRELRSRSADDLLQAALKMNGGFRFWPNVDGYFFPEDPAAIYSGGKQAHVALLAGWNQDEQSYQGFLGKADATPDAYAAQVRSKYPEDADQVLKIYPGKTGQEVKDSARALASDQFIAYSTWKWLDLQVKTGQAPVYRYHFEQAPPASATEPDRGAYHSADILYVFQTLDSENRPWTDRDRKLSDMISSYWTNFAKTGNPNGPGMPEWPGYTKPAYDVMHLICGQGDQAPHAATDEHRARYEFLDRVARERASAAKQTS